MEAIFLFFVPLFFYLCIKIAIFKEKDEIAEERKKFLEGIIYFDKELFSESLAYFDIQSKLYTKSALVHAYRAKCHLKLENYYQSIYYCEKAASLSNEIPDVFLIKGICLFHIQEYELALKEFSKANWYFHEKSQETFSWRAKTHQKLNQTVLAEKDLAQVRKLMLKNLQIVSQHSK
jgi:tetratricopeptide (TPR) repeat protein